MVRYNDATRLRRPGTALRRPAFSTRVTWNCALAPTVPRAHKRQQHPINLVHGLFVAALGLPLDATASITTRRTTCARACTHKFAMSTWPDALLEIGL